MTARKVLAKESLLTLCAGWKAEGLKITFTNGCFDILHLGHVDYLEKTAALGDKLIVAVNSDRSVSALKGENRPINPQDSRARLLAALEFVDAVVIFDAATPEQLIREILPDTLVKGGDYERSNIVGADIVEQNGGRVEVIELVEGFSTTQIIEKIKLN